MGDPLRVLIVAPHYAEYTVRYARALAARCEVALVLDEKGVARDLDGREALLHGLDRLTTIRFRTPADLVRLLWFAARFHPSALHLQEAAGPRRGMFTAIAALVLRRSRVVLTVHDPQPHAGRDAALARRVRPVRDYVRRRADVVVVHGPSCATQYRRATGDRPQRLLLGTHGVILEPDRVEPLSVAQPLRLLFFGRMESYKGVEVMLDAVSILKRDDVEFSLTVAGRGPELDRLSARFTQIPQVRVINRYVESPELIRLIQESECVVLPYLGATQSGVLAAAYAGRRYVVASATGGLVDVVSHLSNGILVSPGNARHLAEAIRSLAGDVDLRERLLRGAEVTATTTLNWDRIAADVHDALERCGR